MSRPTPRPERQRGPGAGGVADTTPTARAPIAPAPADRAGRDSAVLIGELGPAGHRWRPGERLEHIFERRVDALVASGRAGQLAVDMGDQQLTYVELEGRANRLARRLRRLGITSGSRVALLCDDAVATYTSLLAVLKAGAAYVPLDVAFPDQRIAYIVEDAGVELVVTTAGARDRLDGLPARLLCLDDVAGELATEDPARLAPRGSPPDASPPADSLCYIVYTSGTTGRPKGVMIDHSAICHFVGVAAEVYGVRPEDRMYQGLTIAFDFSVEEIWVAWAVGATLVPRLSGGSLLGADLHEFLTDRGVTALCCVPTLLATLEDELPAVRFLLVSGEACPRDLVARWHRPDRRFLNTYGPTETTVTATFSVVHPDRPVTLGGPLPGYSATVLDPDGETALPSGELGEIAIAGIGLATGYLNRPDLTARAFVPDRVGVPDNPAGRLYRTGDLGRIVDGEVEYHGRIDTQVKIRGYRIELTEIESILLQLPGVAQAVVSTHESSPGTLELVGYYTLCAGAAPLDVAAAYSHLRGQLPAYMVPAYLEELPVVPMTASDKADRKALPAPRGRRRLADVVPRAEPVTPLEEALAGVVGQVLGQPGISVTSNLFDDLGADSLLLARICARAREQGDLPGLAIKDVYQHPTIRGLAARLADREGAAPTVVGPAAAHPPTPRAGPHQHLLCGALQAMLFAVLAWVAGATLLLGYDWITAATGMVPTYGRMVAFGGALFLGACLLPVVAKWLLVGRWRAQRFPVWSMRYLRLWLVKTLLRMSPLAHLPGSPLLTWYLRMLGARVGAGALVLTNHFPVCTDLVDVGAGAVVHKDAFLNGYRIADGVVETGPVRIGREAVVGEMTVLEVHSSVGDGAELAHASSLRAGQAIPAGERWLGSPAGPGDRAPSRPTEASCGRARRIGHGLVQVGTDVLLVTPALLALAGVVLPDRGRVTARTLVDPHFYLQQVVLESVVFWAALGCGLGAVVVLVRVLSRALVADHVYPLYGWRWSAQRTVSRLGNLVTYQALFGDSSAIVHWLRALGWDLGQVEQTGSNFGTAVRQELPALSGVGTGTMVSDGMSMLNADFSGTSFRVRRARVGPRTFVGNDVAVPPDAPLGENCLLATRVHVPADGPLRHDVGLLGSPPFEIPRSVERDRAVDRFAAPAARRAALRAKNRHNAVTAALFLLVRWGDFVLVTLLLSSATAADGWWGTVVVAGAVVGATLLTTGYYVLVERSFRRLRPLSCPIYERDYWHHERYWKVPGVIYTRMYNGTPFKALLWRALGVRIGRRVVDDGCWVVERTLTRIGDDCTLGEGSLVHGHSLEDGMFKSDWVEIGAGCTLGTHALVHYSVRMGDGAFLEPDSFLMKGQVVGPGERWGGNPAHALTVPS